MTSESINLKWFGALTQTEFESGWLLHATYSICSWIYQSEAPWHLISWKLSQICLWISHLYLWIYDSIIRGSRKQKHFSKLWCHVNNSWYWKKFIKNAYINYIVCVDEGLIKISDLLHGAPDKQGAGRRPHTPSPKFGTAVHFYVNY